MFSSRTLLSRVKRSRCPRHLSEPDEPARSSASRPTPETHHRLVDQTTPKGESPAEPAARNAAQGQPGSPTRRLLGLDRDPEPLRRLIAESGLADV